MNESTILLEKLNKQLNSKFLLFIDMDGVVADFDRSVKELTGKYPNDHSDRAKMWKVIHAQEQLGEGFYANLRLMADARQLIEHCAQYNPVFLTATGKSNSASVAEQKKIWLNQHFPGFDIITVKSSSDKQEYVPQGSDVPAILIDDRVKSISPWRDAGGWGILHTSAQSSIKELDSILKKIKDI